jgi:hypothetical protein
LQQQEKKKSEEKNDSGKEHDGRDWAKGLDQRLATLGIQNAGPLVSNQ